jgi:hypothetical protein
MKMRGQSDLVFTARKFRDSPARDRNVGEVESEGSDTRPMFLWGDSPPIRVISEGRKITSRLIYAQSAPSNGSRREDA